MLKFFSTKRYKNRTFNYIPRYYDPEREALLNKLKARGNDNVDGEMTKLRLRQEFATYKSNSEDSVRKKGLLSSSSLRLLVIIIILSAASYIILDNLLPKMMKSWFPEAYETEIEEVI